LPAAGNCLQRLTFDQAEQSEATEDGFQRIREVTGLTDVMDIVHKSRGTKNAGGDPNRDLT
jgi:hypothetical protein